MPERINRARIIAEPNGSGKSTLFEKLYQSFDCGIYINTDDIKKVLRERQYLNLRDYHIDDIPDWVIEYVLEPLEFV